MSYSAFGNLYNRVKNLELNPPSGGSNGYTGSTGSTGSFGSTGNTGSSGVTGLEGNAGANGENGAVGSGGSTGQSGSNGNNGETGATGGNGATGLSGNTGETGLNGNTGETGSNGNTGETGSNGTNGTLGSIGVTGVTGSNGQNGSGGETGSTGTSGSAGNNGFSGQTGENGSTGQTGQTGLTGQTGETGGIGETGENGSEGSTGIIGFTGLTGSTGATGPGGVFNPLLNVGPDSSGDAESFTLASNGYLVSLAPLTGSDQTITLPASVPFVYTDRYNLIATGTSSDTLDVFIDNANTLLNPGGYYLSFNDQVIEDINFLDNPSPTFDEPVMITKLLGSNLLIYVIGGGGRGGGPIYGGRAGSYAYGAISIDSTSNITVQVGSGGTGHPATERNGNPTRLFINGIQVAEAPGADEDEIGGTNGETGFGGGGGGSSAGGVGGGNNGFIQEFGNFPPVEFCNGGDPNDEQQAGNGGSGGFYLRFQKRNFQILGEDATAIAREYNVEVISTNNDIVKSVGDSQTEYVGVTTSSRLWQFTTSPEILNSNTTPVGGTNTGFLPINEVLVPRPYEIQFNFLDPSESYVQRIPGLTFRLFNNSVPIDEFGNYIVVEQPIESLALISGRRYQIAFLGTTDWYFVENGEEEVPPGTTVYNVGDEILVVMAISGTGTASEIISYVKPQEGLTFLWNNHWIVLPVIANLRPYDL
jgi:hypothetical protein